MASHTVFFLPNLYLMFLLQCFLLNYYTSQEDFRRLMYIYIFVPHSLQTKYFIINYPREPELQTLCLGPSDQGACTSDL